MLKIKFKKNRKLSDSFGIGDFIATKDTIIKLAFIIVDQNNKNIFDILNTRLSYVVAKYFKHYPKKQKAKVKSLDSIHNI